MKDNCQLYHGIIRGQECYDVAEHEKVLRENKVKLLYRCSAASKHLSKTGQKCN